MEVEDMKRFLTILLALFLLVMTMPALAEKANGNSMKANVR